MLEIMGCKEFRWKLVGKDKVFKMTGSNCLIKSNSTAWSNREKQLHFYVAYGFRKPFVVLFFFFLVLSSLSLDLFVY